MQEIHAMHRKMERLLGYNPDNEIRSDTGGVFDDKERAEELRRQYRQAIINEEDVIPVATIRYNFEKQTERYFRYKSRGIK